MSEHKIFSFYRWILLSLLVHLAIAALVLLQQPKAVVKQLRPAPITVFAVSKSAAPAPPTPANTATVKADTVKPDRLQPPAHPVQPERKTTVAVQSTKPAKQRKTAGTKGVAAEPAPAATATAPPTAATDIATLLHSVAARTAQRELSAAELAALTAPKAETFTNPETTVRRPAIKPGTGPAADVLETLPDGSQLVRVGKGCVLATPGADLRKDIHSMKVVGCGAGGHSEQDRIDAHFEQVMSKVGQHR
ncbi:hypothetical protein [Rheinheimera texasensis]|uniref:hypothetical protein n=1 Tax=Rheinheimera texasensis TaxID=306205 RepID=UPI0032B15166